MQEIECALCGVKYEIEENISHLTCMICDTTIIENSHKSNKISEEFERDSLSDLEDFDLDALDDIENFDDEDEEEEETTLLKELKEDDFIVEKWDGESYSEMIKNFAISPLDINSHKFNYIPSKPKNILARFLYLRSKASENGILSLQKDIKTEPNPILRLALALAFNGTEPDHLSSLMKNKKYWFKQIYLNYSLSKKKKLYVDRVMLDFESIIAGIMILQSGEDYVKLIESFQNIYKNVDLKYKTIKEFETSKKEYLSMNDSYLLLSDEDTKCTNNLHDKELHLALLDMFNKKRDELQPIEMYVLEDIQSLAKRLLLYSISCRKIGVLEALVHASLKDKNKLIRHLFQYLVLAYDSDSVSDYCDEYIQNQLLLASKYHSKEFILLYNRELELIRKITLCIISGESPLTITLAIMSFYPEVTFSELLLLSQKESSNGI